MVVDDPMQQTLTFFSHYSTAMAPSRWFFTTSLLLFSLLTILASASDYSYGFTAESYVSGPKPELDDSKLKDPDFSPKSTEDQQDYGSKPDNKEPKSQDYNSDSEQDYNPLPDSKPQPREENVHDYKPQPKEQGQDFKPQPEKENDQDSKPKPDYKPQPEKEEGQNSKPKPDYKPQPSNENGDDSKPVVYKPQPEEEEHKQDSKPEFYKPQPEKPGYDSKPTFQRPVYDEPKSDAKEKLLLDSIEGLVFCKKGSEYFPIKGAVVRITCLGVVDDDFETAYTDVTDEHGYFFKTLSPVLKLTDGLKLIECKAYLEDSNMENCKVPTDVNRGIRGALLNSHRRLPNKNMNLFTVGPFFYTTESQYSGPKNG